MRGAENLLQRSNTIIKRLLIINSYQLLTIYFHLIKPSFNPFSNALPQTLLYK